MVIFVSQCEKKAHKRTRRVLDAFADRIGDNTWRTVITKEGLQAVQKLLRKTASKNTAVACHWLRSRKRSDLLWIVGQKHRFDPMGRVPVNYTTHPQVNTDWENNWQYATVIQIMATLAALLHDIGKNTLGFQQKLEPGSKFSGDPYRHEWISLRLFEWLLQGVKSDEEWLHRFCRLDQFLRTAEPPFKGWTESDIQETVISQLPPLAQWLGWLLVSHHRMPVYKIVSNSQARKRARKNANDLGRNLHRFYQQLGPTNHWVRNPRRVEKCGDLSLFWSFEQLILHSPAWQKKLKRWARKALSHHPLMKLGRRVEAENVIANPLLLHLSRLCLMIGDYNYSSLPPNDKNCVTGSANFKDLAANTHRPKGKPSRTKQALDEHLLGVAGCTAGFARILPGMVNRLPGLKNHDPLIKPTRNKRFAWQNKAFKLARNISEKTVSQGFFGINMASTGCGKTIGNARILYGLANPQKGARFTIALGLRVLTLQTGRSFRENLDLKAKELAILVGGTAGRELFEYNRKIEDQPIEKVVPGSESAEELIINEVDGEPWDDQTLEGYGKSLGTVIEQPKARDLLFAPIVTCTIDHLMQASEIRRGGRYIVPWIRLLTSDLVLDEPDDLNQNDLPALARLVHLAGLCGTRVLLSSATLTPDFVMGLYQAYQTGRAFWNRSQNLPQAPIVCAWFDEKRYLTEHCPSEAEFSNQHQRFVSKRIAFLKKQPIRRIGEILPIDIIYDHERPNMFYLPLAQHLTKAAISLHHKFHLVHPTNNKTVSIGLIRMANISPLMSLAEALYQLQIGEKEDVHIHLCCYHAKQVLILRSELERKLDRILKRHPKNLNDLFDHPEIQHALDTSDAHHHIFIVLASPVSEIGRDHDYDWAIVEPSSMRSIIQLAGRIWRHRPDIMTQMPNIIILQFNIRTLKTDNHGAGQITFKWPGFEDRDHKLGTHDCTKLITHKQLSRIDAIPRIKKPHPFPESERLSDLEHRVLEDLLNPSGLNFVNAYWRHTDTAHRANTHLQILSPFRAGNVEEEWMLIPASEDEINIYAVGQVRKKSLPECTRHNRMLSELHLNHTNSNLSSWLNTSLWESLESLQREKSDTSITALSIRYATIQLPNSQNGWYFHEWFGFWKVN